MGHHYIARSCTSCKDCVTTCPTGSIFYGINHYVIDSDSCHDCGICVEVCPFNAVLVREESAEKAAPKPATKPPK